jgi:hypothetical protein
LKTNKKPLSVGDVVGRLEIIGILPLRAAIAVVRCSCLKKTVKQVSMSNLANGSTGSCGCLKRKKLIARNKRLKHTGISGKKGIVRNESKGI